MFIAMLVIWQVCIFSLLVVWYTLMWTPGLYKLFNLQNCLLFCDHCYIFVQLLAPCICAYVRMSQLRHLQSMTTLLFSPYIWYTTMFPVYTCITPVQTSYCPVVNLVQVSLSVMCPQSCHCLLLSEYYLVSCYTRILYYTL